MEIKPVTNWSTWQELYECQQSPLKFTLTIDRALDILLGDELTEEEQWHFYRRKHAERSAEKFVRDFIKRCDCQARERAM